MKPEKWWSKARHPKQLPQKFPFQFGYRGGVPDSQVSSGSERRYQSPVRERFHPFPKNHSQNPHDHNELLGDEQQAIVVCLPFGAYKSLSMTDENRAEDRKSCQAC